jgi:hypothetical protein
VADNNESDRDRADRLQAELDKVDAALEHAASHRVPTLNGNRVVLWLYATGASMRGTSHEVDHDGSGPSIRAALVALAEKAGR